jgi:cell division protein FtsB
MNRHLLLGAVIVAFVGLGVLYAVIAPPRSSSTQSAHPQTTAATSDLAALAQRIESLEREVAQLQRNRGPLESPRPAPRPAARVEPARPVSAQGEAPPPAEALAEAIAAEASPVRQKVTQLVRDELANMRGEWREVRRAHHEARDDERVETFAKEADLDDEQVSQLTDLLAGEREQVRKAFRAARETFDFRGARETARDLRKGTDQAAAEFLDEKQLEKWSEQRARRRGRGW